MKEKLLALLNENFPEIDFTASQALVDDGKWPLPKYREILFIY